MLKHRRCVQKSGEPQRRNGRGDRGSCWVNLEVHPAFRGLALRRGLKSPCGDAGQNSSSVWRQRNRTVKPETPKPESDDN
jgi:hypothetical protein